MTNLLTRKLEALAPLSDADKRLLDVVVREARKVGPHVDLIREGEAPSDVHLILEGFACRYKVDPTGGRQIMAYLVPGDFCDLHVFILKAMDHSIGTLSPCSIVSIDRARIIELTERPTIARALWWATLVDEATLREWVVNVGARPAEKRVAHLMCELLVRLRAVGLADGGSYELPITQTELADTVGLSAVHVNRVLQRLRALELITFTKGRLVILDVEKFNAFSGFNPNYLHLSRQTASKKDDA
jgi:CRP-like cAMP-binding protein